MQLGPVEAAPTRDRGASPITRVWARASVATTLVLISLLGLLAVAAIPVLLSKLVLIPAELASATGTYRLLTYGIIGSSLPTWLLVSSVLLVSGWIAERWLGHGTMWCIAGIAVLSGGLIYTGLVPAGPPLFGTGFLAAGFAGAVVAICLRRWREVSRSARLVALAFALVYGLAPLRTDPPSLAFFGVFIITAVFAAFRLRSSRRKQLDPSAAIQGA